MHREWFGVERGVPK